MRVVIYIYIYSFIVGCQTQPNKRTWVNSKYIQRATTNKHFKVSSLLR